MLANYRIVKATAADSETIETIARKTWPATFAGHLTGETIDYMLHMMYRREALEQQLADGHEFVLLVEGQRGNQNGNPNPFYLKGPTTRFKPIGYLSYQHDYLPETTKIHKIYLLPNTQGKGYGKALIRYAEERARNHGAAKLRLDVYYENKAIGFYERVGFNKLERYDTDVGNGHWMRDWRMEKAL